MAIIDAVNNERLVWNICMSNSISLFQMLIAAFGYLSGYDGKFEFEKPGQKFNETHYLGMRFVSNCVLNTIFILSILGLPWRSYVMPCT